MRSLNYFLALILFTVSFSGIAQSGEREHKIVFQLTTSDTTAYRALTRQLNNVLVHWPKAKMEVVIYAKGIGFVRKDQSVYETEINDLGKKGVVFAVCENTMKQQKLTKDQVLSAVTYVPVGIAELVTKQEEGWSYIKVGM
jgi:intracellular sulfur oxidation DsrE/DsrF family protein